MKALNNILSGHSADELDKLFVSDPHYAEFLKYVNWRRNCEMGRTTWGFIDYNLGTLFEYASKYSMCEQFFAIGLHTNKSQKILNIQLMKYQNG